MIPQHGISLRDLAIKLVMSVAPETSTAYVASSAGMIGMLLQCLAQEFDRAADARMCDIAEMKALFERALTRTLPKELSARLRSYLPAQPESLKLTDLDALHARGLEALIELHAWAEDHAASAIDHDAWSFLERFATRHSFQVGI